MSSFGGDAGGGVPTEEQVVAMCEVLAGNSAAANNNSQLIRQADDWLTAFRASVRSDPHCSGSYWVLPVALDPTCHSGSY